MGWKLTLKSSTSSDRGSACGLIHVPYHAIRRFALFPSRPERLRRFAFLQTEILQVMTREIGVWGKKLIGNPRVGRIDAEGSREGNQMILLLYKDGAQAFGNRKFV